SIAVAGQAQIVAQVQTTGSQTRGGLRIALATNLGRRDEPQLTTDATGRAQTTLRAGTTTGTARITGTVEGRASGNTDVRIGLDRVLRVDIAPTTIPGAETATVSIFAFEG